MSGQETSTSIRPRHTSYDDGSGADFYFSATDGTNRIELWRYEADGSVGRPSDLNSVGDANPTDLTVYTDNGSSGTDLCFAATDGGHGAELWAFEGGGPPVRLTDLNSSGDASPNDLTVYDDGAGSDLYFSATNGSDRELWRYNANGATSKCTNINSSGDASPRHLATYDDGSGTDLYFSANDGSDTELWRYNADGSTDEVVDISASGSSYPKSLTVSDGGSGAALYFFAYDERGAFSLWRYNGSATQLTFSNNLWGGPTENVVYDGSFYFRGRGEASGAELWAYDGSSISRTSDVNAGPNSSTPRHFAVYDVGGHDLSFYREGAWVRSPHVPIEAG